MVKPGPHRAQEREKVAPPAPHRSSRCLPLARKVVSLGCARGRSSGASVVRRGGGSKVVGASCCFTSSASSCRLLLSPFFSPSLRYRLHCRHRHHHRHRLQHHRHLAVIKPAQGKKGADETPESSQALGPPSPNRRNTQVDLEDFVNTGRTGRRNAMSDIDDKTIKSLSTADLPMNLEKLSCSDGGAGGSGAESSQDTKQPGSKPNSTV